MRENDKPLAKVTIFLTVLAILIFTLQREPTWLNETLLWHIPDGVGAIVAALIALAAARLVLDAARIQVKGTETATAQQLADIHARDTAERERQLRAIAGALMGELHAIGIDCALHAAALARSEQKYTEMAASMPPSDTLKNDHFYPRLTTLAYAATVAHIGLLTPNTAALVSGTYAEIFNIVAERDDKTMAGVLPTSIALAKERLSLVVRRIRGLLPILASVADVAAPDFRPEVYTASISQTAV